MDENKSLNLDFNTIIQMPKEILETIINRESYDGIRLYLTFINPDINYYGCKNDKIKIEEYKKKTKNMGGFFSLNWGKDLCFSKDELKRLKDKNMNNLDNLLEAGRKYFNNFIKYGFFEWYSWSIANWGCKWNATDTTIFKNEHFITFKTPWAPPINVIEKLSEMHPEIIIHFQYAEEQKGFNTGYHILYNGYYKQFNSYDSYSEIGNNLYDELWSI